MKSKKQESVSKHLRVQSCRERERKCQGPGGEHEPGMLEEQQGEEEEAGKGEREGGPRRERGDGGHSWWQRREVSPRSPTSFPQHMSFCEWWLLNAKFTLNALLCISSENVRSSLWGKYSHYPEISRRK